MDSSAVQAIANLAVGAADKNRLDTFTPAIILIGADGRQTIQSIEHLQAGRSRFRGTFSSTSLPDFAAYVTSKAGPSALIDGGAQGFIDADGMQAKVYFNLGTVDNIGHADNVAVLKLKPTAAYSALRGIAGRPVDQRTLHDFVEDWRDHIVPITTASTGISGALAAIRDITIDTARSVNAVERDMGATRSAMERVDASSKLTLPSGFQFTCVPYAGLSDRLFRLRLGVNTGGDNITLVLRIQQAEQATEEIADDFRDQLAKHIGDASTLTLGTFTP